VRRLGHFLQRRLPEDHPVLARLPEFLEHAVDCGQLRLRRMGIVERPVADLSPLRKAAAVVEAYGASLAALPLRLLPRHRLTETYLRDPAVARPSDPPQPADEPLHIVR
jgi:hypothetical protein